MNKLVKLKAKETSATNSDFYNLFRPIAPSIDVIGKVAQVISGLTEAITIWYITQSEMAGASKAVSIVVSIFAMLLVVALLELGGRKFLQVLTRALVWKRLKNAWYISLFVIVALITTGMGVLSFRLSTNGVNHAFVSNVPVAANFDASELKAEYRTNVASISERFDGDLKVLERTHDAALANTSLQFDSRMNAIELKVRNYDAKYTQGHKWAKSQADKYRRQLTRLEQDKANTIIGIQSAHSKRLEQWQRKKNNAFDAEKLSMEKSIAKGEHHLTKVQNRKFENASFWGGLFSFFVGFSVILAFVCIISVEVYRRGSGIQVEYHEEEEDTPVLQLFWKGLTTRLENFFRRKAESFARIPSTKIGSTRIGFDFPQSLPTNHFEADEQQTI